MNVPLLLHQQSTACHVLCRMYPRAHHVPEHANISLHDVGPENEKRAELLHATRDMRKVVKDEATSRQTIELISIVVSMGV